MSRKSRKPLQYDKFRQAAEELDVDNDEGRFRRLISKIAPKPKFRKNKESK